MTQRSRADLLYALANTTASAHDDIARLLGFEVKQVQSNGTKEDLIPPLLPEPALVEARHAISLWTIQSTHRVETESQEEIELAPHTPLPDEPVPPMMRFQSAWRTGRHANAFDQLLACPKPSRELAIRQAAKVLAQGAALKKLPKRPRKSFYPQAVLLLDLDLRLRPAWDDLQVIEKQLRAFLGADAVDSYLSHGGPFGQWYSRDEKPFDPNKVPKGMPVLIASDFGAGENGQIGEDWSSWLRALPVHGGTLRLLSIGPLRERRWPHFSFVAHGPDDDTIDALLTALSQTLWPDVAKLRQLNLALGGTLSDALAGYQRPEIERQGNCLKLHLKAHQNRLQAFKRWPAHRQEIVRECVTNWGQYLSETWREAEKLLSQLGDDKQDTSLRLLDLANQGELERANYSTLAQAVFVALADFSCLLADTNPSDTGLQRYLQVAQKIAVEQGLVQPLRNTPEQLSVKTYAVQQHNTGLVVVPTADAESPLLEITAHATDVGSRRSVFVEDLSRARSLALYDLGIEWQLQALAAPVWAELFYRHTAGHLVGVHEDGIRFELVPASAEQPQSTWRLAGDLWPWAKQAGIDEHGLWTELDVDNAAYRLRWIPPGSFMMGSPDNEQDRRDNEHLHEVTLSQGYWLGETSVTQALWQAITGNNPSGNKKSGQLPVNDINWNDCRGFIKALQKQLPSFEACFPTEAQWEYACRAGTQTAYWWGDEPSEENGNMTESKGIEIETQYPVNDFGLKSMHGNLFEWCQDWYDEYPQEPVTDPQGPENGQYRVLRGGSWIYEPQYLRAADRDHNTPDSRNHGLGLRLAGGLDPQASRRRGVAQTADRDERNEEQRGGLRRPSPGKKP